MGAHHIVAYLITLAVGYWVLTLSSKEEKPNRTIGQIIGWAIIVVSIFGALCLGACKLMSCHADSGSCSIGSSYSSSCPYTAGGSMSCCPEMKGLETAPSQKGDSAVPTAPPTTKKNSSTK